MRTEPRTLAEMQHRPTSYEVVAKCDDGPETRLAFSQRNTKAVLLDIAFANRETLLELIGDGWDGETDYTRDCGWIFGPVSIRFSGRTERDCASL